MSMRHTMAAKETKKEKEREACEVSKQGLPYLLSPSLVCLFFSHSVLHLSFEQTQSAKSPFPRFKNKSNDIFE